MAITFDRTKKSYFCLTKEQYIKLYSNPVSGIAFDMNGHGTNYDYAHGARWYLANIRYSKSMLINALNFWHRRYIQFSINVAKATNGSLMFYNTIADGMNNTIKQLNDTLKLVRECPDSFLFSHRHIQPKSKKYNDAMDIQLKMILEKYPELHDECSEYGYQEITMSPYFQFKVHKIGLEFTVFPNEFPYIKRIKIVEVGKTKKGNTFIIKK